jgi:hypothetical protein
LKDLPKRTAPRKLLYRTEPIKVGLSKLRSYLVKNTSRSNHLIHKNTKRYERQLTYLTKRDERFTQGKVALRLQRVRGAAVKGREPCGLFL